MVTREDVDNTYSAKLVERLRAQPWYEPSETYEVLYRPLCGRLDFAIRAGGEDRRDRARTTSLLLDWSEARRRLDTSRGGWLMVRLAVTGEKVTFLEENFDTFPPTQKLTPRGSDLADDPLLWCGHWNGYDQRDPQYLPRWWKEKMAQAGGWDLANDVPTFGDDGYPNGTPQR